MTHPIMRTYTMDARNWLNKALSLPRPPLAPLYGIEAPLRSLKEAARHVAIARALFKAAQDRANQGQE